MKDDLTRKQILEGGYQYPTELFKLHYTKHVMDRLEERSEGLDFIPTTVKVTSENIWSGRPDDQGRLTSMVLRLDYSHYKYLFICCNPYDGGLKSMWFREKRYDRATRAKSTNIHSRQAIRNDRRKNNL